LGGLCPGSGYRTAGSNQQCGSLTLSVARGAVADWAVADWAVADWGVAGDAAFSIFFGLQVANFDVFLFLVLHVCYLSFVGLFSVCFALVAPNSN
jgi:hypothetical protein